MATLVYSKNIANKKNKVLFPSLSTDPMEGKNGEFETHDQPYFKLKFHMILSHPI